MKRILSFLLFLCVCTVMNAQVSAGDVISGNVHDDIEGLMMVNVVEKDANNRIVAHGQTDMNGNFSFKINNPRNKLVISYVGYKPVEIPIDRKVYDIKLEEVGAIQEVVITAERRSQSSGLQIPITEISTAQQTISMKEFEGLALTSVDEALQGRIAGLDIVMNSGNLGAGTTMRLRGVSSINNNANPLIVVNGNVFTDPEDANFDWTDANAEKFAQLLNVNPEDIESISVLKDAAATAIWGSQGANGVIEIKTKRGARGKTKVQYSYRFTGNWQPEGYKLLNGDDYTMFLKEAFFNPQLNSAYGTKGSQYYIPEINYDPDFSEYHNYNDNTDWRKAVQQFGTQHQHFISFSGGGEKANFRISGGYESDNNSIIEQHMDRFTTRVALDYFVSNRITVRTNFDFTYTKNKRNYTGYGDLVSIAFNKMPNLSIYEEDEFGHDTDRYYTMDQTVKSPVAAQTTYLSAQYGLPNPIALAHEAFRHEKNIKLTPEFILNYELLGTHDDQHRLTYEGQVRFDISNYDDDSYFPGTLLSTGYFNASSKYNAASTHSSKGNSIGTRHSLTFRPHFNNEDHSFMAMLRGEFNSGNSNSQDSGTTGMPTSSITSTFGGGINPAPGSGAGEWKSVYFFLQAHYAYKGKYAITATLRRDGSTRFGKNNRWGNFPGISARWNISKEKFMEKVPWISMLSIRPGWGIVGTPPGGEGLFRSFYDQGAIYMYSSDGSMFPRNIRMSDLKWEQKETWNIGFDFGFFDDLITGDVSIYTQKSTDLQMNNFGIPSSAGYSSLAVKNSGSMRNSGWEFNIFGNKVVKAGKFEMDFNVTFANNRNEILSMEPTVLEGLNQDFQYKNDQYLSRVQIHNPLGSIYGFKYKGVYRYSTIEDALSDGNTLEEIEANYDMAPVARNEEGKIIYNAKNNEKAMYFDYDGTRYRFVGGDAIYEDINHDGNINELDIVYLGSSLPKLTGGFGIKFRYDRWSINFQFNYRYGNKVINHKRLELESMTSSWNQSRSVNWRWRNEGDHFDNILPRAVTTATNFQTFNSLGSDRFVEDASFIRLNYISLSYSVDPKKLKEWGLSQLSFYLNVNNIFTLTKYSGCEPEVAQAGYGAAYDNSRTPRSKSFTLGTTIAF